MIEQQVWHASFDPHTMAPDVEPAPLAPMPALSKSPSLGQFLKREEKLETPVVLPAADPKYEALSKQTGLSVATLMQVKSLESQIATRNTASAKTISALDSKREVQQTIDLANSIRQLLLFRQSTLLKMVDLVASLQSNKSVLGEFQTDK